MSEKQKALNEFISKITFQEGGLSEARLADVRELVRLIDLQLEGRLYKLIEEWHSTKSKDFFS
jgi:hypothetical protein